MTDCLTVAQVAKYLTVSPATVRRLISAGILESIRVSPRRIAIPAKAVKDYRGIAWQSGNRGDDGQLNFNRLESAYFAACRQESPKRRGKNGKSNAVENYLKLVRSASARS